MNEEEKNAWTTMLAVTLAMTLVTMWLTVVAVFTYDWYRGF